MIMTLTTRLRMSVIIIVMSVVYAVLVGYDPDIASAVAVGYVAILLTIFALTNFWKRP